MRVEQQQARQDQLNHDEALQSFHSYVYAQLNSPRKDEILQRAAEGHKKLRNTFRFLLANIGEEQPVKPGLVGLFPADRWITNTASKVFKPMRGDEGLLGGEASLSTDTLVWLLWLSMLDWFRRAVMVS